MKRIALLYDFSVTSMTAIQYAIDLFGFKNVEYTLVHALNSPFNFGDDGGDLIAFQNDQATHGLNKYKQVLDHIYKKKKPKINVECQPDNLVPVIENNINNGKFNVLVMGAKGFSMNRYCVFGRNCKAVLNTSNIPVLTVPGEAEFSGNIQVGIVPDDSISENRQIQLISTLLPSWKCAYSTMENVSDLFKLNELMDRPFLHLKSDAKEESINEHLFVTHFNAQKASVIQDFNFPVLSLRKPTLYIPDVMYA